MQARVRAIGVLAELGDDLVWRSSEDDLVAQLLNAMTPEEVGPVEVSMYERSIHLQVIDAIN